MPATPTLTDFQRRTAIFVFIAAIGAVSYEVSAISSVLLGLLPAVCTIYRIWTNKMLANTEARFVSNK